MTDREKAIVMAHTGICMLAGEKFRVFHAYIEDIMGRPVYTHELAIQSISDEIKEKSRDDFIKLCKEEQEPCEDAISRQAVLDAIDVKAWEFCDYLISKNRNDEQKPVSHFADNLRECVREELPSVTPQQKKKKQGIGSIKYMEGFMSRVIGTVQSVITNITSEMDMPNIVRSVATKCLKLPQRK